MMEPDRQHNLLYAWSVLKGETVSLNFPDKIAADEFKILEGVLHRYVSESILRFC